MPTATAWIPQGRPRHPKLDRRVLRRSNLLTDARQGAGFPLADALCRLLATRALAAEVCTLHATACAESGFFDDLSSTESSAAAAAVTTTCTTVVFGFASPKGPAEVLFPARGGGHQPHGPAQRVHSNRRIPTRPFD